MSRTLDRGALITGILFIVAGVAFLLESLDVIELSPGVIWPVLVIGFGIAIAFGGRTDDDEPPPEEPPGLDIPLR